MKKLPLMLSLGLILCSSCGADSSQDYNRGYLQGYEDGYMQCKKTMSLSRLDQQLASGQLDSATHQMLKEE